MKKKLLSIVLALALCLGLLPTAALAVEDENPGEVTPPTEQVTLDEGENDEEEEGTPPTGQVTPNEDEDTNEPASRTQLTTPTDLHWGQYNEDTGTYEDVGKGYLSWQVPVDGTCQNRFQITIYRREEGGSDVQVTSYATNNDQYDPDYEGPYFTDGYRAFLTDFETGTYYFTVQSLGDDQNYSSSEISAPSDDLECVKAAEKLPALESPGWDYPNITWTPATDNTLPWSGINVIYYFSQDADKTLEDIGSGALIQVENWSGTFMQTALFAGIYNDQEHLERIISQNGEGYYYFRIRALSSDTSLCDNSDWSELSPAYDGKMFLESVKGQLSSILNGDETDAEAIRSAVQELDTTALKTAMQAEPDVLETISDLEAMTGVTVDVSVDEAVAGAIPGDSVRIIGAGLNELSEDAGNSITLNIGAPEKENVIPELYSSTLAVSFSMGLDGVKDPEALKVPVRITLPVPSNINRNYLVVLHYAQSGGVETVTPIIFSADGKTLSFVLTSFSDFAITQEVQNPPTPAPTPTPTPKPDNDSEYVDFDSNSATQKNRVTIASNIPNGSLKISTTNPSAGSKITIVAIPSPGYITDTVTVIDQEGNSIEVTEAGTNRYTFVVPDTPVEISAVFVVNSAANTTSATSTASLPYSDIDPNSWYFSAVQYMYRTNIMTGTSATTFAPTQLVDRASFATILYRLEGTPSAGGVSGFADVETGAWYAYAVAWTAEAGIVNGISETSFAPTQSITRQDLVVMLYRYAQNDGYDITASGSLAPFSDAANVSGYAVDAMLWAIGNGIITGKDSSTIDPAGSATRSEVAAILMRFCEKIKN